MKKTVILYAILVSLIFLVFFLIIGYFLGHISEFIIFWAIIVGFVPLFILFMILGFFEDNEIKAAAFIFWGTFIIANILDDYILYEKANYIISLIIAVLCANIIWRKPKEEKKDEKEE